MANLLQSPLFRTTKFEMAVSAAKLLLLSTGIVSIFMKFKVAVVPHTVNLSVSTLPRLWDFLRSGLSPPYIYITVNFIILIIAVSYALQHPNHQPSSPPTNAEPTTDQKSQNEEQTTSYEDQYSNDLYSGSNIDYAHEIIWHHIIQQHEEQQVKDTLPKDSPETFSEDTSVTEAGEDKDDDHSLDATWKAIMEAQGKPMTRQLKKSDTWDGPPRLARIEVKQNDLVDGVADVEAWAQRELRKSDTFSDRVSLRRRDKSMSQDELKHRSEAFIKKINDQIRLQRLESEQRFQEMVNRSV